jgi:hypothetical protein
MFDKEELPVASCAGLRDGLKMPVKANFVCFKKWTETNIKSILHTESDGLANKSNPFFL